MEGNLSAHVENEKRRVLPVQRRRTAAQPPLAGRPQPGEVTLKELEYPHLEQERPPYA